MDQISYISYISPEFHLNQRVALVSEEGICPVGMFIQVILQAYIYPCYQTFSNVKLINLFPFKCFFPHQWKDSVKWARKNYCKSLTHKDRISVLPSVVACSLLPKRLRKQYQLTFGSYHVAAFNYSSYWSFSMSGTAAFSDAVSSLRPW